MMSLLRADVTQRSVEIRQINKSTMIDQEVQVATLKKYVQSYGKADNKKAVLALCASLAYEVLAVLLINLGWGVLGWTIHTLNTVRIFIQFHDMAHFSFFPSIKLNTIVGKIFGIYVHYPFNTWRDGHNHHHKHFGNLDRLDLSQTILFTKKQYEAWPRWIRIIVRIFRQPVIFFFVTLPYVWFVGNFYTVAKRYGIFSMSFLEKVTSVVLYTWIFPMFGVSGLKMWVSIIFSSILGTILFHLQHSVNLPYRERKATWNFEKAALEGSTFLDVPPLLKPFTCGIQYHHIHHLNTNVPSYTINNCHDEFEAMSKDNRKWDQFHINRVNISQAAKSIFNVMLDEDNSVLVPFDYCLF